MLEFVAQNWSDITSNALSAVAIVLSVYSIHRANTLERHGNQDSVYADLQRLLNHKCDFFSSEQKAMNCYCPAPNVSLDDEKTTVRRVRRFFGRREYRMLCDILSLCDVAKRLDLNIGAIFDVIKRAEPEKYAKICSALVDRNSDLSEQEMKENTEYLSTISVRPYNNLNGKPGKTYDYSELSGKLNEISLEIMEKRKALEKCLEKAMMKG